jgi:putative ABC transport system ATP-binding protein
MRLDGRDISALSERFLTELRRATFGFVFQQFQLIRGLSVLENVMLPAVPTGRPYRQVRGRALDLLDHLGLAARAETRAQSLSGGEAQRVAIARALINDPKVVIADEPTSHLDSALSRQILTILGELRGQGRTLILSSHDPLVFESDLVERIVEVRDGRVVAAEK